MVFIILVPLAVLYVFLRLFSKNTIAFISELCIPFVKFYISRRIAKGLEDKNRVNERFGIPSQNKPSGKIIWIHAVSVGETLSVIPVINMMKKENPDINILLTTTTVTAAKQVEQRLENLVIHQYMPFDIYSWVKKFLDYWKPAIAIFVESELWANMLYSLHDKNIPIYLLNARISEQSLKRMFLVKKFLGILPFSLFKKVFSSSPALKQKIQRLGANNVQILPNLKLIADKLPVNESNKNKLSHKIGERKTWIAVSTHPGEEEIVINVHKSLKKHFPEILTIIAIRHPARTSEVCDLGTANDLSTVTYSETMKNDKPITEDLLIVDKMGQLGNFFAEVSTALVCGSLMPGIGGHNFLEPIKFACKVATGKYIENFKEIYPNVANYCKIVNGEDEIVNFVISSLNTTESTNIDTDMSEFETRWEQIINGIL